jgi:chorismate--pyruvate lyase
MSLTSFSPVAEPAWVSLDRLRGALLPTRVAPWLKDEGSLTRAIIGACEGRFSVQVQQQGWGGATPSERRLLGMSRGLTALLREVELLCDEKPWVFARTLIPATSLVGGARRLAHLGNRPLGAVLFADPNTRRLAVEVARIDPRHALYHAACSHMPVMPDEVWGRRTLFAFAGQKLLVNEIFLPTIPERS